ncbi:MAG: SAM-dependent methyltransferase [Ornithinibacter sp.]
MRVDDHHLVDAALSQARASAFAPGEYVDQQSFVTAGEVLSLARRAGVAPGVRVLDLCCGVGGPGLHVMAELGCDYLGVDASAAAVDRARQRASAAGLAARFAVAHVPPLPPGRFDVVLLLETLLAFADKPALLGQVGAALPVGGRFAFTVEEGLPLTAAERAEMPGSDTVWLTPLETLRADLEHHGLRVTWCTELTASHLATVDALVSAYAAVAPALVPTTGEGAVTGILTAHRTWGRWLREGRVRKFALVAEKVSC